MTREEQIRQAAKLYDDPYTEASDYRSFVDGAKWAEEHPQNPQLSAADRGIIDEIIFALNSLGKEKMISYHKEIEFLNKIRNTKIMTQEEKELLLKDLEWINMETRECHCYNCELFDRKNNFCKCIDLCKNPKRTYKGFYIK